MNNVRAWSLITTEPINLPALFDRVSDRGAGAVATFSGVVRDHDGGRAVHALEYEAHPIAQTVLENLVFELTSSSVRTHVAAVHRVGPLQIGDIALGVAVSTPHRAEAFALLTTIVDRIKAEVPIWKHQFYADGSDDWVNAAG